MYDNVRAQHKLVTEHFGITHARAVLGWSMGSAQASLVPSLFKAPRGHEAWER